MTDSTAMELQLRVQKRFADSYFDTTASDLKVQTGSTIYVTIFQYVPVLQINLPHSACCLIIRCDRFRREPKRKILGQAS